MSTLGSDSLANWDLTTYLPLLLRVDCPTKLTVPLHIPNTTAEKSAALPPLNMRLGLPFHCIASC